MFSHLLLQLGRITADWFCPGDTVLDVITLANQVLNIRQKLKGRNNKQYYLKYRTNMIFNWLVKLANFTPQSRIGNVHICTI